MKKPRGSRKENLSAGRRKPFIKNALPPIYEMWFFRRSLCIISLGGEKLEVEVKITPLVSDVEVLITAQKKSRFIDDLVDTILDFDKDTIKTVTGYVGDRAHLIEVADIVRIYSANQKVYIQTIQAEYATKFRLYEMEDMLKKQKFLRISNSEIINIKKIENIDLSIIGRICIHLSGNICAYASRRYIPKIKTSLGI